MYYMASSHVMCCQVWALTVHVLSAQQVALLGLNRGRRLFLVA